MSSGSANRSYYSTLVASTVDTVTLNLEYEEITVVNRNGSAEIYYTLDGSTPTVGGDSTYLLPAAIGSATHRNLQATSSVKLISSGTPTYGVVGGE